MYVARLHLGDHDGKSKEISACSPNCAHYITLFFNYACTFWKVVNNRTVQFKWVAGVEEAGERRLELEVGASDDKPDTRPVNVTAGCSTALPQSVDKASKHGRQQTYLGTIKSAEKLVGSSSGKASSKT